MPAALPPKRINGAEIEKLRALRKECATQFLSDPDRLAQVRADARKTILERKIFTESEIDEIETEEATAE